MLLGACATPAPPENVVGDYLSARFAAHTNDVFGAATSFSDAQRKAPGSPEIRRNSFYFDLAAGDMASALAIAEGLAADENAGDGGFAKAALAARALKAARFGEAERLIAQAAEAGFPPPAAKIIEVWAVAGSEGESAALNKLRTIPGDEYRGFYPVHAALLAENLGRVDDARNAYQLSVMAFSGSTEIVLYGEFLERHGDEEEAREYYELLASQDGFGRFAGRDGLTRLDRRAPAPAYEETTPAKGAAIALYSLSSGLLQDTYNRRAAARQAGFRVGEADYNLSLAMTQLALYLYPDYDDARRFAGSILNVYGEHERAIDMLSMVDRSSPYYEQAQIEIANALRAQDQPAAAARVLKRVIDQKRSALDAQLSLAALYAAEGDHRGAVAAMDHVIAGLPADPAPGAWRYYLTRAASLLEIDQWPRAETDLKRAVEIAPEEATALNYLGYSWAERGVNLEQAFDLIEKAVALQPSSGAIIDSLGWAYYQRGDYQEAVGHLEQAASIEPADPTITDHLGDVYWRLGRRLEARYQWRRVLELDADEALRQAVEDKIDRGLPDPSPEPRQEPDEDPAEEPGAASAS